MVDRPKALQKARQERRLAAALRENLTRRKTQAKGRAVVTAAAERNEESAGKAHNSAGIGADK